MLVQFPFELKDVLVSDPDKVDAVVQASNRVFLIAKRIGQTNAFFFDTKGQQVLTLEIIVGADLKGLDDILRRFVPGSNVQAEMAGNAVVLTGTVRTPLDAKRAADIACQFVAANRACGQPSGPRCQLDALHERLGSANTSSVQAQYEAKTQTRRTACGSDTKLVINLLTVEGEEQVMLKVTVAEVQRSILKQFGINLGAAHQVRQFLDRDADRERAAAHGRRRSRHAADPGPRHGGARSTPRADLRDRGVLCNYNHGSRRLTLRQLGPDQRLRRRQHAASTSALRALERDGLVRTLAEPNLTAVSGETAKFLAGGEFPIPVVDSDGKLSVTFKEFGVGLAFTPVVLSEGRISLKIDTEVSELTDRRRRRRCRASASRR